MYPGYDIFYSIFCSRFWYQILPFASVILIQKCPSTYRTSLVLIIILFQNHSSIQYALLNVISFSISITEHRFNFDNVSVLDYCLSVKVRLQPECIHTELQSNFMNRSINMNSIHHSVINRDGNGWNVFCGFHWKEFCLESSTFH